MFFQLFRLPKIRVSRRQTIWLSATAAAITLMIVGLALSMLSIERQLDRWQLLPRPSQPTELSFTMSSLLPHNYTPGAQQSVSFTITNPGILPRTYHYAITETDASGQHTVALLSGSSVTKPKTSNVLNKTPTLQDMGPRAYIRVSIDNNLSIGYWAVRK